MSQSASPIGSVEFIVKFETMQGSFIKAMKEGLKNADINIEKDSTDSAKIDEILYNIRYRLRTPFTGNFDQFRAAALAEIEFARSKGATSDFASALRSKNMVIKKSGENEEEYKKRSEETASILFTRWIKMMEDAIKDPKYYEKNKNKFTNLQGAIQQAMSGSWEYMVRTFVDQIVNESEVQEAMKNRLREFGFDVSSTERSWGLSTKTIRKPGAQKEIKTEEDLLEALGSINLSPEQIKELTSWDPQQWKKVPQEMQDEVIKMLDDYWVHSMNEKAPIPRTILRIWQNYMMKKADWWADESGIDIAKGGDIRHDALNLIKKAQINSFKKFLQEYDVDENEINQIVEKMEEEVKKYGWALLPWEGKVVGTLAKWRVEKLKGRDPNIGATFALAGPTGFLGGISSPKILDTIENMPKEELKELIAQSIKDSNQNFIDFFINESKNNNEFRELVKGRIEEAGLDPSKIFGSG